MGVTLIFDLQKASMWKRVSAWLLDAILLVIVATLMALLFSYLTGYDGWVDKLDQRYALVEAEYGVSRSVTQADIDQMDEMQLANLEAASKAISEDAEANHAYLMLLQLMVLIASLSLLFAFLLMEFAVPMLFKNGQTIGKKIFGVAVMRVSGVRINGVCLFIRTILGKFTIETMIPVMMFLMLYIGAIGLSGLIVMAVVLVANIALLIATKENAMIHDKLANTVTVDMASQMIFNTVEELIARKQAAAAEAAAASPY